MLQSLLRLDADWSARMRVAERPGKLRTLAALLAHSGDSWFWGLGLALLAMTARGFWRTWALTLLAVIAVAAVLVLLIKFSVRRRRPEGEWGQIYRNTDPHSFPSGHAVRAVMLAVLTLGIGPHGLGLVLLFWAPLVALARVAMGVHYLSDVVAGGVLGLIIGLAALQVLL
ncbi:MAG: hypothetical protein Fur0018_09630 [Anaerolineales bacterium]